MKASKVISLRLSNQMLANCLEFEELLKGSKSEKLSSSVVLLIESSLKLLRENKRVSSFTEEKALYFLEDFLKRNNRSFIGRERLLEKGSKKVRGFLEREKKGESLSITPMPFPTPIPDSIFFKEEKEKTLVQREKVLENAIEVLPLEDTISIEEVEITKAIRVEDAISNIEKDVEIVKAMEENELLQKIFMKP